jgi:hypothetical protein
MERLYTCVNGHSFKVISAGGEPPPNTGAEVYFDVNCLECEARHEIGNTSDLYGLSFESCDR